MHFMLLGGGEEGYLQDRTYNEVEYTIGPVVDNYRTCCETRGMVWVKRSRNIKY